MSMLPKFASDFALKDQFRRSAISVPLNISEGFARRSKREFRRFLIIAHGSIAEVQTCPYIALDLGYIDNLSFDAVYREADEISRMISGMIRRLES